MPIYLAVVIGLIFGNILFNSYQEESVMESMGNVYLLQYGAYTNEEILNESVKKLDKNIYYIKEEDQIYYVYLGATSNYDNATRLKKIMADRNIFVYLKNDYFASELVKEIKVIDDLIMESDDNKSLEYLKNIISLIKR